MLTKVTSAAAYTEEADLAERFRRWQLRIAPKTPPREIRVAFYPYVGLNNTIRLRQGVMHVRLSDLLKTAPPPVLDAIAAILLGKLFKKPISDVHERTFREYAHSPAVRNAAERLRRERGFKFVSEPQGAHYDLVELFNKLNLAYFSGALPRPTLTWSRTRTRRILGHYDAAHATLVISRTLDDPRVPPYFIEYVLYHEMLHIKHRARRHGARTCVHTPEFHADEREFVDYEPAMHWMKRLPDLTRRRGARP
jgi:hypothetical protein